MKGTLYITGDPNADELLNTDALALLIGMLLDQQVPMEWAFKGPATLKQRLGHLDAARIAAMSQEEFVALCCEKPAIHRFPGSMGKRVHELCTHIVERYGADASRVWSGVGNAETLQSNLQGLPGYGVEKARIFTALLAKRMGVRPQGWEAVAGAFADPEPRSVADIDSAAALAQVREWKKAAKAAGRSKQD